MFPCFLELVYGSCVEREEAGERELYVCAMLEQNADSVRYNPVCRCVCNLLDLVFPSGAWKEILKKRLLFLTTMDICGVLDAPLDIHRHGFFLNALFLLSF